ncbi:MAG: type I-B CRISPR-associated protein Cas7/Csh2 [Chloroflexota bacterium]
MADVTQRSEILFLYDVTDSNPNGDPLDENKPRIDEETNHNIVTDVRLKRTVRDYLATRPGIEIFVQGERKENGDLKTKDERLASFGGAEDLLKRCIDLRLFGATIAIKERRVTFTGPVQFKLGRSLNRVDLTFIKGTTVMPSGEGKAQGTMTEEYRLPYSLIAFYGIVNENAARLNQQVALNEDIRLSEGDVDLLLEGLWNGTANLISRSKFGQRPRLLLRVRYRSGYQGYVGELDHRLRHQLVGVARDEALRDVRELRADLTELLDALAGARDRLDAVSVRWDPRLVLVDGGKAIASLIDTLGSRLPGAAVSALSFPGEER